MTHIIQVKLAMGLFDSSVPTLTPPNNDENKVALQAAEESLVLLKNSSQESESTLPIKNTVQHIILLSPYNRPLYDDIGTQCGGWRIKWQGMAGNDYTDNKASSILTGIQKIVPAGTHIVLNEPFDSTEYTSQNTIAIALLAEQPYAEFFGDVDNDDGYYEIQGGRQPRNGLYSSYDNHTLAAIHVLKDKKIPIITVLISGRPLIVNHLPPVDSWTLPDDANAPLQISDAFIAAWLPGTTGGEAIANAILGCYHFKSKPGANTLSLPWPTDIRQVETGRLVCESIRQKGDPIPQYECGYGLST